MHESTLEFEAAPSSVAGARQFVRAALIAGGAGDDEWTVVQVVSELATNAVLHAGTAFVMGVAFDESHIKVWVTDRRPLARATIHRFSDDTTTGRGLRLVQLLGRAWGVDQTDSVKTVWCELRRGFAATDGNDAAGAA